MNKLLILGLISIVFIIIIMFTDTTSIKAQPQVLTAWEHPQTCVLNTSDWPCLEEKGC